MKSSVPNRIPLLDVIRVLACALIVAWHIAEVYQFWWGKPLLVFPRIYVVSAGGIGVSIFLALSGLVLQLGYSSRQHNYWQFIYKRCLRIYPVYWACLGMGMILYLYREWFLDSPARFFAELSLREWACSVTGTCAFFGWWGGPFLVTGWFIGVIVALYLCFPPLSSFMHRYPPVALVTALGISLISHAAIYYGWLGWGWSPQEWFPLARLFEFAIGMWLGERLSPEFWHSLDELVPLKKMWAYLAELTFPYFLLHFELKFLLAPMEGLTSDTLGIASFLLLTAILSQGALVMGGKIMNLVRV